MTVNDGLALLAVATALRVFLPDLRVVTRRLLRASVQAGVAELVQTRPARPADTLVPSRVASQDGEA
ncbi:hypothetical protein [Streptomyces fuscichromogenes]|uniref:hypothetical protein n=1 Tax=Streptomyces fuscichromogenes TaxID=1324013 RepID=UPI0016715A62|nr:hypothetical protein [Streptomyces fuscichromogenes]